MLNPDPSLAFPHPASTGGRFRHLCGLFLAVLCLVAAVPGRGQTPGTLDTTFNAGSFINGSIYASVVQSDGKVLIGGDFTNINGNTRNGIARLNANGSLDTAFNPGVDRYGYVNALVLQPDGKVLLGGNFSTVSGAARKGIARLNADGSLDAAFNPVGGIALTGLYTSYPLAVYTLALQSDGKVIVGGSFDTVNGTARNSIARLNADGSLDTAYNPGNNLNGHFDATNDRFSTYYPAVQSVAVQADGKVVAGGNFNGFYNGNQHGGIFRVNVDGSLDTDFTAGTGTDGTVYSVIAQANGKILIGGRFTQFNGTTRANLARLNATGALDTTLNPGSGPNNGTSPFFKPAVYSLAVQSDNKILLSGNFSQYNGTSLNGIARVSITGGLDTSFNAGYVASSGYSLSVQTDGKILYGKVRLNTDGTTDASFDTGKGPDAAVYALAVQTDGKKLIGGTFYAPSARIARVLTDGAADPTFAPGSSYQSTTSGIVVQADGKIVFTSIPGSGSSDPTPPTRLNSGGTKDIAFNVSGYQNGAAFDSVALQADSRVVFTGRFYQVNTTARLYVARFNTNGSEDTTFNVGTGPDAEVFCVAVQPDGKILIGGAFTKVNGITRNHLARLNADGSLDPGFDPGAGADSTVRALVLQPDGKILLGGSFTQVGGEIRFCVARVNANGAVDVGFDPGSGVNDGTAVLALALQTDGKVLLGGDFSNVSDTTRHKLARLNTDGSLDTTFDPGTGPDSTVRALALQSDGQLMIGGDFYNVSGVPRPYVARVYTHAPGAMPNATTGGTDSLTATSATLRGTVNPQGNATTAFFQYGATTAYGTNTGAQNVGSGTTATAFSTAVSGLASGTVYHYRVVATNSSGTTYGADGTFTTLTVAQDWSQQYFGTTSNTGAAADSADPDGDGIVNLLERALGLNPTVATAKGLPTAARDGSGHLVLTASRGPNSSDLVFAAESSADLVNWSTANVTVLTNTSTVYQARDDNPPGVRRYLRLRVTKP